MLVTDTAALGGRTDRLLGAVGRALGAGVSALQLRDKGLSARKRLGLAVELRELTRRAGVLFLVNGRVDIAMLSRADGVHLPSSGLSPRDARALMGEEALIGLSTHSLEDALAAEEEGADYVTFGPVYETPSKAPFGKPKGPGALEEASRRLSIPVLAIGGVREGRAGALIRRGAAGVALISAVLLAPDPAGAARRIRAEVDAEDPWGRAGTGG